MLSAALVDCMSRLFAQPISYSHSVGLLDNDSSLGRAHLVVHVTQKFARSINRHFRLIQSLMHISES